MKEKPLEKYKPTEHTETPKLDKSDSEIENTVETQTKTQFDRTQQEWETDRRQVADAKHDALNRFVNATVIQRVDLLRDCLAVSITALIGAITVFFIKDGNEFVKTKSLFIVGIVIVAIGIIINLMARVEIIKHLQAASFQIEDRYLRLYQDSRAYLSNPTGTNLDTAYRTEYETASFPPLGKIGENGYKLAVWSLVSGVVMIVASLFFRITFN